MLREFPDIVIEGARQVGKSMLARQLVPTARAVNLDEVATRDAARADPALLLGYEGSIIIDEIQHVPELTLAVRANIDENRHPGKFILTGSASLLRVRGLADSLAGRVG